MGKMFARWHPAVSGKRTSRNRSANWTISLRLPNSDVAPQVTIRQLLTHTGGTGDIFTPEYEKQRLDVRIPADYVKLFGSRRVAFQPGSQWAYSNYGYIRIIEKIADMSYYHYVRIHIFEPWDQHGSASSSRLVVWSGLSFGMMGVRRKRLGW